MTNQIAACPGCGKLRQVYDGVRDRSTGMCQDCWRKPWLGTATTDWASDGLCAQTDPDMFFPEIGGPAKAAKAAKAVCRECPVAKECLEYALANGERYGVWGGLSERERRRVSEQQHLARGE